MAYCAAPGHAPGFVVVVADRTPLSDSSSASPGTHPGTCSLRPPFNTTLLGVDLAAGREDHNPDDGTEHDQVQQHLGRGDQPR